LGYVYSSWWKTSPPRTSTGILNVWLQCDYKNSLKLPYFFNSYVITPPFFKTLRNWCFLMSSNLQLSVQLLKFFTRNLWCSIRKLDPLEHKNFRKNPQDLCRWNETIDFTLEPWLTQSISLNEPTYNPYITLAILWLKEQNDSKKKCLFLKNVWAMRFEESRENICIWFNKLGVMRKWVYIEKGGDRTWLEGGCRRWNECGGSRW